MLYNALAINVGGSIHNRSVVMDVFSFVHVLFILDPPIGSGRVCQESGGFVLFMFEEGCDVEVYVRYECLGWFVPGRIGGSSACVVYRENGEDVVIGGVYVRPKMLKAVWDEEMIGLRDADIVIGDFNARHGDWDGDGWNLKGDWTFEYFRRQGMTVCRPGGPTFRGVSTIDLCATRHPIISVQYTGKCGLEHDAILLKLSCDAPDNINRRRPAWKKVDQPKLWEDIRGLSDLQDNELWPGIRKIVDGLPRSRHAHRSCSFWNDEMERLRRDVRRARKGCQDSDGRERYNLVRRVYRAMLIRRRAEHIGDMLARAREPEVFRLMNRLEPNRTIPDMVDRHGNMVRDHSGIADLVAEQLHPEPSGSWSTQPIDLEPVRDLGRILDEGPRDTTPGVCDIGYPLIRRWYKEDSGTLLRLINHGLRHDIEDWHTAEVVLIAKADKPTYNVVKSWRMIHLLPTLAKTAERVILSRIACQVSLDETQFGSQPRKGCHDMIATVYEFLRHNQGMRCAMLSMDVEGGFDNVVVDHLSDFMAARGCEYRLIQWCRRWAWRRRVTLRFNGLTSKPYHTFRGVPQGSPLSPFLFGIYVADIFRCRLVYTPSRRSMVASYVDDGVILVAADSQLMAVSMMVEIWEDCRRVARLRNMDFSSLKTGWIGFGDTRWGSVEIGGTDIEASDRLRVLGFYFNMYNNFDAHVDYWLDRGIGVRGRIGALGRRYGGEGGIGAWEMVRLLKGAYLATVYYGLEFVADHGPYVRRIQTHVNSCVRSLFRIPNTVATKIILAEFGIFPTHVQARYIQRRRYARAVTNRYNKDLPWSMEIREGWADRDIRPDRLSSEHTLDCRPLVEIPRSKGEAIDIHDTVFGIAEDSLDARIVYTDGSKSGKATGAAWLEFRGGHFLEPVLTRTRPEWDIAQCELYAIWDALRCIGGGGRVCVFTDSTSVLRMIDGMAPTGKLSQLWHVLVPLINRFESVAFGWSPGHAAIPGNEMADVAARNASGDLIVNCSDVDFGGRNDSIARRARRDEWAAWHKAEGHSYYNREPRQPRHMKGMSRLDAYILLRLRAGIPGMRHEDCGDDERFHLLRCPTLVELRPDAASLYDDRKIGEWVAWWRKHDYIGIGIPRSARYLDDIRVVGGNPFTGRVYIREDGDVRAVAVVRDCGRCLRTGCDGHNCRRPVLRLPKRPDLVFMSGIELRGNRAICLACSQPFGNIYEHLRQNPDHLASWSADFWNNIADGWDDVEADLANTLVIRHVTLGPEVCPGCDRSGFTQGGLGKHLREKGGDACFGKAWKEFVCWLEAGIFS